MRIVSQNKKHDAPYEQCVITCDNNIIHCAVIGGNQFVAGEYESAEKAQKAMELMHGKWESHMALDGGVGILNDYFVQPNFWVLPRVFRFPADDEVEVST